MTLTPDPMSIDHWKIYTDAVAMDDKKYFSAAIINGMNSHMSCPSPVVTADMSACPECGSSMVTRRNRSTGISFYGCSTHPQCWGSRALDLHVTTRRYGHGQYQARYRDSDLYSDISSAYDDVSGDEP